MLALAACQNSTSALTTQKNDAPLVQKKAETEASLKPRPPAASVSLAVDVKDGVSEATKICTSQGSKFQRTSEALKRAGYKINPAKKIGTGAKASTLTEAYSANGKYIVKLGTAANGFKSCQVLFRTKQRTAARVSKALSSDKRLNRFVQGQSGLRYRFIESGHTAQIQGPLTSSTSNDVGLLLVISQVKGA